MKRAVLFTDHFSAGGIGVAVAKQAIWLSRFGWDVVLVCNLQGAVPQGEWDRMSPGMCKKLVESGVHLESIHPSALGEVVESLRINDQVLMHASWRGRALARATALRESGRDVAYFLHSSCESQVVSMSDALRRNLESATIVVTGSGLVDKDIREVSEKIEIRRLFYGVDPDFCSHSSILSLKERRPSVLFVGRPNRVKGGHLIPRIAQILSQRGIELWVHGVFRRGRFTYSGVPNVFCSEMALSEERMADLIRQHCVLIVPSTRGEGQPLIVLEALACGTVVVATKGATGGLWKNHPVIVRPPSADAISNAVFEVLSNPVASYERTKSGVSQVKDYTWEKHVADLCRCLRWS